MIIKVKVIPRARQSEIASVGAEWRVKLKAVPERGQANEELRELLARHFKIAKSRVAIIRGLTSRKKLVRIDM